MLHTKILSSCDLDDPDFAEEYHHVLGAVVDTKTPLTRFALNALYANRPVASDFVLHQLGPLLTHQRSRYMCSRHNNDISQTASLSLRASHSLLLLGAHTELLGLLAINLWPSHLGTCSSFKGRENPGILGSLAQLLLPSGFSDFTQAVPSHAIVMDFVTGWSILPYARAMGQIPEP